MVNATNRPPQHWVETQHLRILRLVAALLIGGAVVGIALTATQSVPLALGAIYLAPIVVLVVLVTIESVFMPPR